VLAVVARTAKGGKSWKGKVDGGGRERGGGEKEEKILISLYRARECRHSQHGTPGEGNFYFALAYPIREVSHKGSGVVRVRRRMPFGIRGHVGGRFQETYRRGGGLRGGTSVGALK